MVTARLKRLLFVFAGINAIASAEPSPDALPPVTLADSPVVNGINMTDPGWPDQPLVRLGLLDVSQAPFSADTRGEVDATDAIQRAVEAGRANYLTVFFPSGRYKVTRTIEVIQPEKMFLTTVGEPNCNEMREVYGGKVIEKPHCARTAPVVLQGTQREGAMKPELFVPAGTGLSGPVVRIHNPINDNINMNQEFIGIDVHIEDGNPDARGIYARGAQGVSVQDVVIRAGSAAIGLEGGAGSGGSHIGVTVIGGRIGMKVGSSQPAPTLTGITLINQTQTALLYEAPGRQTLSVTGLKVQVLALATGPAIDAEAPISLVDVAISGPNGFAKDVSGPPAIRATKKCSLFMQNVWVQGFSVAVLAPNGVQHHGSTSPEIWVHFPLSAAPSEQPQIKNLSSNIFIDGAVMEGQLWTQSFKVGPPEDMSAKHLWGAGTPTWEARGACNAHAYGAKGDLLTDDTIALQRMLDDPKCKIAVLPKGYFSVTSSLKLAANAALVGVGMIYSNIVSHPNVTGPPGNKEEPWPLLETSAGRQETSSIVGLSFLVWRHTSAVYAFKWQSGGGLWRRAHMDRVDVGPGTYQQVHYAQPLSLMVGHGGGEFYNFYQENWDFQGPEYRHLLVSNTDSPWTCYHCNLEHSQGEANLEIQGAKASIRLYGYKGEGNYVQVWIRDSADFQITGYGGNASPFPKDCDYPPGYGDYTPSIFRIERTQKFLIANIVVQAQGNETRCGIYDTGFAGVMYQPSSYSVLVEVSTAKETVMVPPLQWPVLYARGLNQTATEIFV
eukprot:TRINITY_DN43265_c0_g1_i1.p1 TRINITY_DN43265_c0_g1~~TRINITY_DN43265_c0_g1_i1.p1  ORF type:complete len:780 (-),score=85.16 TRINITY_DN43265_c0_g1_i1:164-2503(-)